MNFWKKLLNWIIEKSLKDVINYIKKVVGDAKVAADVKGLGGWGPFFYALIQDLLKGVKEINAMPATKGAPVQVYKTQTAVALFQAKKEGRI
jgi:predicted sugar kinase